MKGGVIDTEEHFMLFEHLLMSQSIFILLSWPIHDLASLECPYFKDNLLNLLSLQIYSLFHKKSKWHHIL